MSRRPQDFSARILLGVCAVVRRLPNFRGKVRFLLHLHRLMGLDDRHVKVTTTLHRPTSFRVRLDLFCMHERMAFFMDEYEPGAVTFLSRLWPENTTFVDVGANIGLITIPFTVMNNGRFCSHGDGLSRPLTYCIEALASNSSALAANVQLNHLDDPVRIIASGVGECEKDVDIQVEKNQKAGAGTGTANILSEGSAYECERIRLHVTTIDRLLAEGKLPADCGLMKLDTDGYDLFALMGGRAFLEQAKPIIYGEFMEHCLKWHGQSIHDVQAYLAPLGYRVYIRSDGWKFTPLRDDSQYQQDALCVPAEQLHRLSWCIG